jgi:anaerobic ribonucleoside-triphosphate reductase activating protein
MMNIHNIVDLSEANGPGKRTVFWVQGCDLGCPGCANPASHKETGGSPMYIGEMLDAISPHAEGVTISGGEPFQQDLISLATFIGACKARGLSVVLFTGYSMDELQEMRRTSDAGNWLGQMIDSGGLWASARIDLMVAGRYVQELRVHELPLLSTSNQKLHYLSDRYTEEDVVASAFGEYIFDFAELKQVKTGVM